MCPRADVSRQQQLEGRQSRGRGELGTLPTFGSETGWKFRTGPPGTAERVLAHPGSGGSAVSIERSRLQNSASASGSRQSIVISAQATEKVRFT